MTYTNEMVLPRNFAQHSEDEMMYLDGGFYVDYNKCGTWATHIYSLIGVTLAAVGVAAFQRRLKTYASTVAGFIRKLTRTTGGVIGLIVGAIGAAAFAANAYSFGVGICTADRKNTGVDMKWRGVFCNYRYY